MAATIIANIPPYTYGSLTNQSVSRLVNLNTQLVRLAEAVAIASSAYEGIPGTQFEIGGLGNTPLPAMPMPAPMVQSAAKPVAANLFGVQASETPGEQGSAYSYAVGQLHAEWEKFWTAAEPYIAQLDNGTQTL